MLYDISSSGLTVRISSAGAQLMSVLGADGTQYLWQGDPTYWADRAINIFPYVARLTNGCYTYGGKRYSMPIHGFAPTAEFTATEVSAHSVTFVLECAPDLYAQYPFQFRYSIRYRVEDDMLHVDLIAENLDNKTMYLGLGGHPGINVPLEDGLCFEDYQLEFPPCHPRRVEFTPSCFITGQEHPFPLEQDTTLPLHHGLFDDDAIVLKGVPGQVTLRSPKGRRGVTLLAPDLPVYGFWHAPKTDAPYVCLEPWSSLPSRQDVVEDLEAQEDLIAVPAGETYQTTWSLHCF